jgi:RNA recognition motif-containing protein
MVPQNSSLSYPPQTDSSSNLKLFVGGLYYQSEDEVLNFFKQYGEVVD